MGQQEFCKDCKQKHNCQDVFEQLGYFAGPSVVLPVIAAFLLPLLVFIASLAAFEEILLK